MPTYSVRACRVLTAWEEVEAESPQAAEAKVREHVMSDYDSGSWYRDVLDVDVEEEL